MKTSYKIGDVISPKPYTQGFDKAVVYKIDNAFYHVKIMNGIATIPIHVVENNYRKVKTD